MSERSITIRDEDGKFQFTSIGCSPHIEVLGLIEAARIYARCIFIDTLNESRRAPVPKEESNG